MSLPDDYLSIDTPENVAFGYDVAGIGSRFLAALVDTILILILQAVVNIPLILLANLWLDNLVNDETALLMWMFAISGFVAFIFFWGYYIFFEMIWNGQSPGKRWVGLQVIRTNGTPITLAESIIRNLIRLVDFLPAYYGVGIVTMFINEQSRRLGDLAAGTLVVHSRATVTLESLAAESTSSRPPQPVSAEISKLPLERLTSSDIQMVEDFLRRRDELSNRAALAQRFLKVLHERMEQPSIYVDSWEAERLLSEIIQACRDRETG
ncbi:RDD family protein [Chloroflexota bacterium]